MEGQDLPALCICSLLPLWYLSTAASPTSSLALACQIATHNFLTNALLELPLETP
jgi:hypothetical protein